jgi:hypothetical protein
MSSGTGDDLSRIWGSSLSDVFAVGNYGTIMHYDGSAWGAMTSGTTTDLIGVWGSSPPKFSLWEMLAPPFIMMAAPGTK